MEPKAHWEQIYTSKASTEVSWYEARADRSLKLIDSLELPPSALFIDIGGGASTLVDGLLARGYRNVTVLDISSAALAAARQRLGAQAGTVRWLEADVTEATLPVRYDLWHDRAVFHFLTERAARQAYIHTLLQAVKPGGHVIIATFAEDGPQQCSGLPVRRYSAAELQAELGEHLALVAHERELHHTPSGGTQQFTYTIFEVAP